MLRSQTLLLAALLAAAVVGTCALGLRPPTTTAATLVDRVTGTAAIQGVGKASGDDRERRRHRHSGSFCRPETRPGRHRLGE
jgi:hypothetical protein